MGNNDNEFLDFFYTGRSKIRGSPSIVSNGVLSSHFLYLTVLESGAPYRKINTCAVI